MNRTRLTAIATAGTLMLSVLVPVSESSAALPPPATAQDGGEQGIPSSLRDALLAPGWRTSADLAWTTSGDATGLHLLVAEASSGYTWRTAATLGEPGLEADRWIGNACVTASGERAVVVYAPRTFTNDPELARRGGFTAIVDLRDGTVTKLPVTTSLAYFNPGCGAAESVALTQEGDEDLGATRLLRLDATTGTVERPVEVTGQVTSAVPAPDGLIAASGYRVVRIGDSGTVVPVAATAGVPWSLRPDAAGGVSYLDQAGGTVRALRTVGSETSVLAEGGAGHIGLHQGTGGRVFLTGDSTSVGSLPSGIQRISAPASAELSTDGGLALTSVATGRPGPLLTGLAASEAQPAEIGATVTGTGQAVRFAVDPRANLAPHDAQGRDPVSLSATGAGDHRTEAVRPMAAGSPTNPVDTDRWCSIARNDARTMAYQPTPRQVEWAVDMAMQNVLTMTRGQGYRGFGLPAYSPQGMFPPRSVHVPPQIFLGVLSQESNLWQASGHLLSGEYGNPLTGNVYGLDLHDATGEIVDWVIHWDDSDCGYGISQMTDGMRTAGREKPGETALPAVQQRAVALDYQVNIAAGMRLLQDKWNEVAAAGMTVNNADPARIENWYFATWAYNSGFHKFEDRNDPDSHGAWGLGWFNNPINPRYPQGRLPFLHNNSWGDAAHPQDWPYPEKVIGFASWSIDTPDGPGFRPAWWINDQERLAATPPKHQFCDSSNNCQPGARHVPNYPDVIGQPAGPCAHTHNGQFDLRCWYHQSNTWKPNCPDNCGHELIRFDAGFAEPPDGTHYPPRCDQRQGLPANAQVVDDVPTGTPIVRCGGSYTTSSTGTFSLSFEEDSAMPGTYPGKVDFHQIAGGNGGHFWFAHSRLAPGKLNVTGTWRPSSSLTGWTRIKVFIPDHGAQTQLADYVVRLGNGETRHRVVSQNWEVNTWVDIGVFNLRGGSSVSLSSAVSRTETTAEHNWDIAYDAIAFIPTSRPVVNYVALGDSFSAGEGHGPYDENTDYSRAGRDSKCHRSKNIAYPRLVRWPGSDQTIAARARQGGGDTAFAHIACSFAETESINGNTYENGETPQLRQGYLDQETTLVTVTVGGNDADFTGVVKECSVGNFCEDPAVSDRINNMQAPLHALYRAIDSAAPNARILVLGYPLLFNPEYESRFECLDTLGIDASEAQWLNEQGDLLNAVISAAVDDTRTQDGANIQFLDVRPQFAGHAICDHSEPFIWGVTGPTAGWYHPNGQGVGAYAAVVERNL
jgi:GDSL-like lipase/acylhydrolase family protein